MKTSRRLIAGCMVAALSLSATNLFAGTTSNSLRALLIAQAGVAQADGSGATGVGRLIPRLGFGRSEAPSDPFTAAGRGPDANPPMNPAAPMNPGVPAAAPGYPTTSPAAGNPGGYPTTAAAPTNAGYPSTAARGSAFPMPSGGNFAGSSNGADNRSQSDALLLQARKALAFGDTSRATSLVSQAKTLGVQYNNPQDDSPAKVQELVNQVQDLAQRRNASGNPQGFAGSQAKLLLEQARGLMHWGQFDEAERLAREADKLPVAYSPYEKNPRDLIAQISAFRKNAGGAPANFQADSAAQQLPRGADSKGQCVALVAQARAALKAGDLASAEELVRQASALQVPDSAFAQQDDRPSFVLLDIQKAKLSNNPGGGNSTLRPLSIGGANNPNSFIRPVQATEPRADQRPAPYRLPISGVNEAGISSRQPQISSNQAQQAFQEAENALQQGQFDRARALFAQAEKSQDQLDPTTRERLRGRMNYLGRNPAPGGLEAAAQQQELLRRQVSASLADFQRRARNIQESYPDRSLALLAEARDMIMKSELDAASRDQLLKRLEAQVEGTKQYIAQNAPRIELDRRNQSVKDQVQREQQMKVEVQEKLAYLVDEFNTLMDQQRYAEAEVLARKAQELAPDEQIALQLKWMSRFVRRVNEGEQLRDDKENGFVAALQSVEESSTPYDDRRLMQFPNNWESLSKLREGYSNTQRLSEEEIEIKQKLRTPVSLRFQQTPLAEVMQYLSKLANVPIYLDPQGMAEEGVATDTPVTINLAKEIRLESALNLILQPLRLSYIIKDEVLKITSEQMRDGEVVTISYNVADLVIPIPNFVPSVNMGMTSAVNEAYRQSSYLAAGFSGQAPLTVAASQSGGTSNAAIDPNVLAQLNSSYPGADPRQRSGRGPGGLGGGTEPDFESLINLITTTVEPESWEEVGGPGSIAEFETNLSLVVSQTQEVHEKIADLLDQLRRLQDLQVTIEVRFITLNDNFFERIGVDFDFEIDDNTDRPFQVFGRPDDSIPTNFTAGPAPVGAAPPRDVQDRDHLNGTTTVGLAMPGLFSADLDVPINSGSFPLAVPQFGGFTAGAGSTIGFAILSDLEAYFFVEASQGDTRTNVLQAPKVTLFNGQQAIISDTSQSPFVISVIPVVGDFAAALQPVIVILNEGTFLSVQAVVSNDRRFVRLTVVPFFSTIGNVDTFTFTGSETTTTGTSSTGEEDATTARTNNATTVRQGTTVQLPTFSFITVSTTVSVPDGGTVLLGGIKRLSEGRNEFGTPILNKVPYLNRLFKNVGIGRETQSLMMMVTPRIIIQEEEEQLLLGGGT